MAGENVHIGQVGEPLSSFSVVVLFLYMLVFTFFRAFTDNNDKDEDFIGCTCRDSDESFYTTIFILFTVIWGVIVIFWFGVRFVSWLFEEGHTKPFKLIATIVLEPFSFLAHLGVLPLLFLQFLSTYAWVCVFGDKYCREGEAPNQLQIDRTGALFGFFLCAGIIGFAARVTSASKSST